MEELITLSGLGHTWILDLDGTVVKHNGYLTDGYDTFLPGAQEFLNSIPKEDLVIFLTSRTKEQKERTERFLQKHRIRYDHVIYDAPFGERILINDRKPSGLRTAIACNEVRDVFVQKRIVIDERR